MAEKVRADGRVTPIYATMIVRPYYLNILKTYRDVPLVKILAGIRRCGKATILDMLKADLLDSGRTPKGLLNEYIRMGGFPIVALGNFDDRSSYQIVEGIYNSVITSEITRRHNITNFDLFNRVVKYVVENVGKTFFRQRNCGIHERRRALPLGGSGL